MVSSSKALFLKMRDGAFYVMGEVHLSSLYG